MKTKLGFITIILAIVLAITNVSPSRAQGASAPQAVVSTVTRVTDINSGSGHSAPSSLAVFGDSLFFRANGNNGIGEELWIYNPSITPIAYDVNPGAGISYPAYLAAFDGALYFSADGNDGSGTELWKFDWTNGAQLAADIYSGATGGDPRYMTVYNDALYFGAVGDNGAGYALWAYDPLNGAQFVTDIPSTIDTVIRYLTVYEGALYFNALTDGTGYELWKYDPLNGLQFVADINPGVSSSEPAYLTVFDGALYFSANGGDGYWYELWKYDPVNGVQLAADIYPGGGSSAPKYLAVYKGSLYFNANGNDGAYDELWKYDPVNGAQRVTDIFDAGNSFGPAHMTVYNEALFFRGDGHDGYGTELWKYEFNGNAPSDISLSVSSVTENLPGGTTVGLLSTIDPDYGDTHTFSFCGGVDDASFQISNSDLLTNAVFDYETKASYDLCIRTTDTFGGSTYDKSFTINVLDGVENSAPTDISLSNNTVSENMPPDTTIGLLSTTDPDLSDAHTYSFCGGEDDASFQINVSNLESVVPFDYEAKSVYNICIRSTDNFGASYDEAFIVNVTDVPGLELILPYNGSVLRTARPFFDWSNVANVKGYQIQVSKKINFSTTVINTTVNGAANSQYMPTKDLPVNSLLYWRVRTKISATKYGPWSVIRTFTTANPPSVPSLVAPANGALLTGPSPLFDWNNSTVPSGVTFDHYQIQIAADSGFVNIVHDNNLAGVTNSQDSSAVLNLGQTYYWRVRAFATSGDYSAWSVMRSVKIKFPAPTLIDPQDQSSWEVQPTFTWTPVPGAPGYTIQISKSPSFGLGTISINITLPTYTHPSAFSEGTTYYWRVRVNGIFAGDWPVVFSFIMI